MGTLFRKTRSFVCRIYSLVAEDRVGVGKVSVFQLDTKICKKEKESINILYFVNHTLSLPVRIKQN